MSTTLEKPEPAQSHDEWMREVSQRSRAINEDYAEYMRRHNSILIHHALEQAELKDRYPVARLDPNRKDNATRAAARQLRRLQRKR